MEFIYSGLPYLQKKLYILGTNYQSTHSFIDKNGMTIEDWPTSFQTLGIYRKLFRIFTYQWKLHIYVREKYGKYFFQIVDLFKCYKIKEKYISKKFKTMDHFWMKCD